MRRWSLCVALSAWMASKSPSARPIRMFVLACVAPPNCEAAICSLAVYIVVNGDQKAHQPDHILAMFCMGSRRARTSQGLTRANKGL